MNWHQLWAGLFCERTKKCTCVSVPEIRECSNLLLVYTPIPSFVAHKTSLDWRSLRSKTCNGDPTSVLRTFFFICLIYDYLDDGKQWRTSPSLRQPSVDRKFLNRAIKSTANSSRIFKTVFDWTEWSEDDSQKIFKAQSLFIRVSFSEFNFHGR